jgi:hypothetical protein
MSVIYHKLSRLSAEREASAKYVSLKELISQSDVISLNLALNESTRNIIGEAEFAEKKRGIVIVNTARSGLVLLRFTYQMPFWPINRFVGQYSRMLTKGASFSCYITTILLQLT